MTLPAEILKSAELTEFAVEARYPGLFEPVTAEETTHAINLAKSVVEWVALQLKEE